MWIAEKGGDPAAKSAVGKRERSLYAEKGGAVSFQSLFLKGRRSKKKKGEGIPFPLRARGGKKKRSCLSLL